jgi:DnaJ family protein C protein 9
VKKGTKKGGGDDADLFALIQRKNAMRADQADDMFAALEAKYAPKKRTKKN